MSVQHHRDRWPPGMQRTVADFIETWCTPISVDPEIDLWEILEEAYQYGWDDGESELRQEFLMVGYGDEDDV